MAGKGLSSSTGGKMEKQRVLLVDDHRLMLDLLASRLERDLPDLEIVGSAGDGNEAVIQAADLRPDLVIMDIDMPGMSCFDAASDILHRLPSCLIMFLSAHSHDEYIDQALRVGARGYIVKNDDVNAIVDAIRTVVAGDLYYSQSVLARVTVSNDGRISLDSPPSTRLQSLTERERQILIMLAKGESVKRVARALNITYKTVDKHKVSLMKKLDIHDRVELCRFAVREHLIEA